MSRVNLKRHNRVHSPSPEHTMEQTESKVKMLSNSEDYEESSAMSDDNSSTGLRSRILTPERIKAKTLMMMGKPKHRRIVEELKLENSELNASIQMMRSRISGHDNASVLHSTGFTFTDDQGPIPNLICNNNDTAEDLVDFLPSPANLLFQQNLSEQECFANSVAPQHIASPVSLRCFKPDYHQTLLSNVCEYVPAAISNKNDLKEVVVDTEDLLHLSFKLVKFLHHPLFSLEHFLVNQIREAHQNYTKFVVEQCSTVKEAKKLRKRLLQQAKVQKQVLKIWSAIKKLRNEQNYCNTTLRLIISTERHQTYSQLFDELVQINAEELQRCNIDEPILDLRLVENELNTTESLEEAESLRRKVVQSTKFTMKILCDGVLVAKSDPAYLTNDFELDFCQTFPIRLLKPPKWFTVELYEHPKGLLKKKIAEIKIELPSADRHYSEAEWMDSEFERREIVHYKHAGIGSGFALSELKECEDLNRTGPIYTRGFLTYKIGWQNPVPNRSLKENDCVYTEVRQAVDRWGCLDKNALNRLLDDGFPRDDLIDFGLNLCISDNDNVDYFRLSPWLDGIVSFCRPEDLNRNIRLKYLKLRDQHEIEFAHIMVPNRVRELPLSIIRDFELRKLSEKEACQQTASTSKMTDAEGNDDDDGEDIETSRASKQHRLKRFYANVFRICEGLEDNMTYESVVDEKYLIYFEDVIRTCFRNTLNWFRWRPKVIEPLPRLIEPKQPTNRKPPSKVQVKILEVRNFPLREEEEVRPVIEVCFNNWRPRIPIADCRGRESWTMRNEVVVELPLKYSQVDYTSPDSFSGSIEINLLDDVSTTNVERYVWLGTVNVPLAALISTYQLSGWYLVHTPPLITGYHSCQNDVTNKKQEFPTETFTYLRLELKIAPSLPSIEPNMANLPSNDPPYIRDHILKWNDAFNSSFPNRKFNALALDIRGRTSCISRFLKPLGPPQLNFNEDFDVTPEQCLRYVSLIPFTDCQRFYNNLWLTSDQLIEFSMGSVVDHCVTLVCFLLALKLEAFLILGFGIPNGFTSYVLLIEQSICRLMDVTYNRIYDLNDPFCPLQKVYSVVGPENVWGNVQRTTNVQLLRFDLKRRCDWWPLFDAGKVAPSAHVVDIYTRFDCAITSGEQLELLLEQKLKRKFSKWRPTVKTSFNQRLVKKSWCRQHLKSLESKSTMETLSEINKTLLDLNVQATIIHSAFTTSHSLLKQVKRLEVHVQPHPVTEFVLGIFVQPYPGSIFSVWVLIGAIQCNL